LFGRLALFIWSARDSLFLGYSASGRSHDNFPPFPRLNARGYLKVFPLPFRLLHSTDCDDALPLQLRTAIFSRCLRFSSDGKSQFQLANRQCLFHLAPSSLPRRRKKTPIAFVFPADVSDFVPSPIRACSLPFFFEVAMTPFNAPFFYRSLERVMYFLKGRPSLSTFRFHLTVLTTGRRLPKPFSLLAPRVSRLFLLLLVDRGNRRSDSCFSGPSSFPPH